MIQQTLYRSLVVFSLILFSCSREKQELDENVSTKEDEIWADVSGYIVTTNGLDVKANIHSSGPWTLTGSDEYIYPSVYSGQNGDSVIFKVTDKPVMIDGNYNADFVFSCGKAKTSITLSRFSDLFFVCSSASSESCNIGGSLYLTTVGASGSFDVRITHSIDYDVRCSVAWMHVNHVTSILLSATAISEAYQSAETIIIDANEDSPNATPDRDGEIYCIHNGHTVATIHISQVGQPQAGDITFADSWAKDYCVRSFDSNGDGEVSFREAANVYSSFVNQKQINANFFENAAEVITSFDEFEHFYHITDIGHLAFCGSTKLRSIKLPPNLVSVGYDAFGGCTSLESIYLPNTINYLGLGAFGGCTSLESVNIPDSITKIQNATFANCSSLKKIVIPNGVTMIGDAAFSGCSSLSEAVLPSTITSIGYGAFGACSSLTSVYIAATTPPQLGDNAFTLSAGIIHNQLKIYVPQTSLSKYKADPKWSEYAAKMVGYNF